MEIAPSGHSAKKEKKVANKLYRTIIIVVILTGLGLIAYGTLSKDVKVRVQNPTTSEEPAQPSTTTED
jgi:hypothetical protein